MPSWAPLGFITFRFDFWQQFGALHFSPGQCSRAVKEVVSGAGLHGFKSQSFSFSGRSRHWNLNLVLLLLLYNVNHSEYCSVSQGRPHSEGQTLHQILNCLRMNRSWVSRNIYLGWKACRSVQLSNKPQNYERSPFMPQQNKMCPQCEQMTPKTANQDRVELCALRYVPQAYQSANMGTCPWATRRKRAVALSSLLKCSLRGSRKMCLPSYVEACLHLRQDLFWVFFVPYHSCCREGGGSPAGRGKLSPMATLPLPSPS